MNLYILVANTVYDCAGEVFSEGYVVGVFSSYNLAEENIPEDNYTRKNKDYNILPCVVDTRMEEI